MVAMHVCQMRGYREFSYCDFYIALQLDTTPGHHYSIETLIELEQSI